MEIGWTTTKRNNPPKTKAFVCALRAVAFSPSTYSGYNTRLFLSAVNLIKPRLTHEGKGGWEEWEGERGKRFRQRLSINV